MNDEQITEQEQQWIAAYCNQAISPEDFARFEAALEASPKLRMATRQYLALDSNLRQGSESLAEISQVWAPARSGGRRKLVRFTGWVKVAAAAAVAFFFGIVLDRIMPVDTEAQMAMTEVEAVRETVTAKGYAVIHGLVDADVEGDSVLRAGDVLGAEMISIASGRARIDFFCGAQVYIEGPAKLEIRSAWEAEFHAGKLHAKVPPAARGFIIESNGRRIVDLGTEFGIDTSLDEVRVEVFDGKVELEDRELVKGEAVSLTKDGQTKPIASSVGSFSKLFSISSGLNASVRQAYTNWRDHSDQLSRDPRLIAYYPFESKLEGRSDLVPSSVHAENTELDGAAILAEWVDGRWDDLKGAMEFRRPGSRVRVNIPGEFEAFTFSCWARIDSLDRQYNALFLADSYQTGEPHWQIRSDGVLMLGVMVDDTVVRKARVSNPTPGLARNYYSPPFWDMSMSGQWLHLVSVYDPANRAVTHYVNGRVLSVHEIEDDLFIDKLRIGNAEIGNWGQPFRKDPEFSIRNLNGRIGELAIFNAALDKAEVESLFFQGQSDTR